MLLGSVIMQAFFGHFEKTQVQKTQSSRKILQKLKQNSQKTKKNSSWFEFVRNWIKNSIFRGKLKGTPKNSLFIIKYFQKLTLLKYTQKLIKKLKTQANSWKKLQPKYLKNPQLQLSWIGVKSLNYVFKSTISIGTNGLLQLRAAHWYQIQYA